MNPNPTTHAEFQAVEESRLQEYAAALDEGQRRGISAQQVLAERRLAAETTATVPAAVKRIADQEAELEEQRKKLEAGRAELAAAVAEWNRELRSYEALEKQLANLSNEIAQERKFRDAQRAHLFANAGEVDRTGREHTPRLAQAWTAAEAAWPLVEEVAADLEKRVKAQLAVVAATAKKHAVPKENWPAALRLY